MSDWYPVASAFDVVERHVFRGQLLGHELAIWRADDGFVNVWENRCLHRGVRLSIGINDGAELVCRYHGWRYANRSAGCTYIPAHPADSPARTIHATTFAGREHYGLVWTSDDPDVDGEPPAMAELDAGAVALRGHPVDSPTEAVLAALADVVFAPVPMLETGGGEDLSSVTMSTVSAGPSHVARRAEAGDASSTVVYFVQPVSSTRSVIRPVLAGSLVDPLPVWRHHAFQLARLVETIEGAAPQRLPDDVPALESPVVLPTRRTADADHLTVRVARKWMTATGIAAFDLEPAGGTPLPTFHPGDHIDVHLPGDLVRQYSLTNGPGETDHYRIGVKLEPESKGGSRAMHEDVEAGDELTISSPRNSFPLRRNVPRTILIAGGIGVTPILSMAQALDRMGMGYELHYFAAGAEHLAFTEVLDGCGPHVHRHLGLTPDETTKELATLLAAPAATAQVYACGPPPMLDAIRDIATTAGWGDDAVRFEYFENTNEIDRSSTFTIELARSMLTLEVPAGESVLDVVRANGVAVVSSCEQGACGTCAVTVVEGEPLHQDVFLGADERSAGTTMLTCVSRAISDRLVLDL